MGRLTMKTPDQIIADYEAAYTHANGHKPNVAHHRGWFEVRGSKVRRAEILRMTMTLLQRPAFVKE
jgi:hypothetical protein